MNELSITPFRGLHLLLLLLTAAAVLLIFLLLRGKPEARRSRFLIGVCFFNLALFAGYKLSLSMDAAYVRAYYPNGFNIFNELPLHLCNINLFLIPLGVWKRNRSIMGFSFFVAPLGALMALLFPEPLEPVRIRWRNFVPSRGDRSTSSRSMLRYFSITILRM